VLLVGTSVTGIAGAIPDPLCGKAVQALNKINDKRMSCLFMSILYRTRSQIALFHKVESAICDRGYFISSITVK
jgi:hypothetical protein